VVRPDLVDVGDHGSVHHGADAGTLHRQAGEDQCLYHLYGTQKKTEAGVKKVAMVTTFAVKKGTKPEGPLTSAPSSDSPAMQP